MIAKQHLVFDSIGDLVAVFANMKILLLLVFVYNKKNGKQQQKLLNFNQCAKLTVTNQRCNE